jgi:hypothetical protein
MLSGADAIRLGFQRGEVSAMVDMKHMAIQHKGWHRLNAR